MTHYSDNTVRRVKERKVGMKEQRDKREDNERTYLRSRK